MKKLVLFVLCASTLCVNGVFAQSKEDLKAQIEQLKQQNQMLMMMLQQMQGYPQQQMMGYPQQQMMGYPMQQVRDASGYAEMMKSPIEQLALMQGTGEIRAFAQAESMKEQFARTQAEANATAELQRKIETYIRYGLNTYNDQTGVNGQYSLDEKAREDIVTAAKGFVEGGVILDTRKLYNSQTKMYKYEVCMKLDRAGVLGAIEAQNARILANRQKFEQDMQFAWDELDARHHTESLSEQQAQRANEMQQNNLDRQAQREANASQLRHQQEMESNQQRFDNNQKSVQQQQDYNLQRQKNNNDTRLQMQQQHNQYNQQRSYK